MSENLPVEQPSEFSTENLNIRTTGAMKNDVGKRRYSLMPIRPVDDVTDVFEFGSKKYGDYNWHKGFPYLDLYNATMRHLQDWMNPNKPDFAPDSGLHHFSHATANLMMMLEEFRSHPELDNRPFKKADHLSFSVNEDPEQLKKKYKDNE